MKSIVFYLIVVILQFQTLLLFRKNINLLYYINRLLKSIFCCKFKSRLVLKHIDFNFLCSNNGIFAECQNIRTTKAFLLQDLITHSCK